MSRMLLIAAVAVTMSAGGVSAAHCKDAKGKFIKCPTVKPAGAGRCKLKGKFTKCGTPGARPV